METSLKKLGRAIVLSLLCVAGFYAQASAAESGTIDAVSGKPCYKCHQSKVTAPFVHSGLASKECTPCHTATGGNHQANKALYGVKDKSSKVCYECHDNQSKKKSVHGPIQEDSCLGCHAPHAANNKFQLGEKVPRLCFGCHDQALILEKDTDKATGYRDGTSNLHFLHAGEKTGIPCLACHDVHASDQAHLIRPKGTNGKEAVTLTFKESDKGGNCTTSCHDAMGYERK
jgi:predicted CXXCH cytochrome family protein